MSVDSRYEEFSVSYDRTAEPAANFSLPSFRWIIGDLSLNFAASNKICPQRRKEMQTAIIDAMRWHREHVLSWSEINGATTQLIEAGLKPHQVRAFGDWNVKQFGKITTPFGILKKWPQFCSECPESRDDPDRYTTGKYAAWINS